MGRTSIVSKYKADELLEELSDLRKRFVVYYMETADGAESIRRAGYKTKNPAQMARKLLNDPKVSAVIGELSRRMLEEPLLKAEAVLRQLAYLVLKDPRKFVDENGIAKGLHELDEATAASVDGFKQKVTYHEDGSYTVDTELKTSPKASAIDMAMKKFGQYA